MVDVNRDKWQSDVPVATSLPPSLQGPENALLRCEVSQVVWLSRQTVPGSVAVRLLWWGESGKGATFRPQLRVISQPFQARKGCKTIAIYSIRCSPEKFSAYVRDMRTLTLEVLDGKSLSCVGQAQIVDFQALVEKTHQRGSYSIMSRPGPAQKIGHVQVYLSMQKKLTPENHPLVVSALTDEHPGHQPHTEPSSSVIDSATQTDFESVAVDLHSSPTHQPRSVALSSSTAIATAKDNVTEEEPSPSGDTERCLDLVLGMHVEGHGTGRSHHSTKQLIRLSEKLLDADQPVGMALLNDDNSVADSDVASQASSSSISQWPHAVENFREEDDDDDMLDAKLIEELFFDRSQSGVRYRDSNDSVPFQTEDVSDYDGDGAVCMPEAHTDSELDSSSETEEERSLRQLTEQSNQRPTRSSSESSHSEYPGHQFQHRSVEHDRDAFLLGPNQPGRSLQETPTSKNMHLYASHTPVTLGLDQKSHTETTALGSSDDQLSDTSNVPVCLEDSLGIGQVARLGRVRAARVIIGHLLFTDNAQKILGFPTGLSSRIPRSKRMLQATKVTAGSDSAVKTIFAEYLFPVVANSRDGTAVDATETVRVAAKPADNGIQFHHRSVFPVHFDEKTLRRWWQFSLLIKVFVRKSSQKPELIGVCSLPLRSVLSSGSDLGVECRLPLLSVDPDIAALEGTEGNSSHHHFLGTVKVKVELSRDGESWPSPHVKNFPQSSLNAPEVAKALHGLSSHGCQHLSASHYNNPLDPSTSASKPGHSYSAVSSNVLHMLLLIPSAGFDLVERVPGIHAARTSSSSQRYLNPYLVCRSAFSSQPVMSDIRWGTLKPVFNFRLLIPVLRSEQPLKDLCDSLLVVEVWNRVTQAPKDQLLGLVKFQLHQFYFSFRDSRLAAALDKMTLPVVSVNGDRPILPLAASEPCGFLRVLLAMGTATQISTVEKQYVNLADSTPVSLDNTRDDATKSDNCHEGAPLKTTAEALQHHEVEHVFTVDIVGVHQLTLPSQQSLWGDSDCYVQYRFLTSSSSPAGIETAVCRTSTTLCVPEARFQSLPNRHVIRLTVGKPVQTILIKSFSAPTSATHHASAVAFDLWQRFYSPNVRDKIMAKAILPIAKLCALVTMHTNEMSTSRQVFSLPLMPITAAHSSAGVSCGQLEVALSYQRFIAKPATSDVAMSDADSTVTVSSPHVCIGVDVRRVTGLQPAVKAVSMQQPSLHFAATAGANVFARVKFLDKASRDTSTVARVFCAEFAHHTEYACQVTTTNPADFQTVNLAELLQDGHLVVQVYHKVKDGSSVALPSTKHSPVVMSGDGTSTHGSAANVDAILLGEVTISLEDLLTHSSGIHGWFSLGNEHTTLDSTVLSTISSPLATSFGAVELAVEFQKSTDRDLVIERSRRAGWLGILPRYALPKLASPLEEGSSADGPTRESSFRVEFVFNQLWLPRLLLPFTIRRQVSSGSQPRAYVRYKFFNKDALVSHHVAIVDRDPSGSESQELSEDISTVVSSDLCHRQIFDIAASDAFLWYLQEEQLEVQVWCTDAPITTAGHLPGGDAHVPPSKSSVRDDFTHHQVATAYIHMLPLLDQRTQYQLSGLYPLVRSTASSLAGACMRCHVSLTHATGEAMESGFAANPLHSHQTKTSSVSSASLSRPLTLRAPRDVTSREKKEPEVGVLATSPPAKASSLSLDTGDGSEDDTISVDDNDVETAESNSTVQMTILVEEALHLPLMYSTHGQLIAPNPYVTFNHGGDGTKQCQTSTLVNSQKPKWNEVFHIRVHDLLVSNIHRHSPSQQALTFVFYVFHQPRRESTTDASTDSATVSGSSLKLPPMLIGQAAVDLTPLSCGLPQLSGWYNVLDAQKHICAQIKITVTPCELVKARLTSSRATVLHTTGTDRMLSMEPSTAVKGNLLLPVDQLHVATESSLVASENSQPCDFVLNSTAAAEDIPPVSSNSDTHSSAALSSSGRLPPCEELSPDQIRGKVMSDLCTLHDQLKQRLADLGSLAAGDASSAVSNDSGPSSESEAEHGISQKHSHHTNELLDATSTPDSTVLDVLIVDRQPSLDAGVEEDNFRDVTDDELSSIHQAQSGDSDASLSDVELSVISMRSLNAIPPPAASIDSHSDSDVPSSPSSPTTPVQRDTRQSLCSPVSASSPNCSSLSDLLACDVDSDADDTRRAVQPGCTSNKNSTSPSADLKLPASGQRIEALSPNPSLSAVSGDDPGHCSSSGHLSDITNSLLPGSHTSTADSSCSQYAPSSSQATSVSQARPNVRLPDGPKPSVVSYGKVALASNVSSSTNSRVQPSDSLATPLPLNSSIRHPPLLSASHLLHQSAYHRHAPPASDASSAKQPTKYLPNFFLPADSLASRMQAFRTSARQLPTDLTFSPVSSVMSSHTPTMPYTSTSGATSGAALSPLAAANHLLQSMQMSNEEAVRVTRIFESKPA